jgi:hypothetical protein
MLSYIPTSRPTGSTRGFTTVDPERQGVLCAMRPVATERKPAMRAPSPVKPGDRVPAAWHGRTAV